MVCGSPGELSNDPSLGDHWLDLASIEFQRSDRLGLPIDTTPGYVFARQREFIWSDIVLNAPDQLRQRMAWALFQIFSLPKVSIQSENRNSELFLSYYDIFVRNAFGNYLDILREITYNPMMAESLSFVNSMSTWINFWWYKVRANAIDCSMKRTSRAKLA
jgi:cullin-associated NEDD8-dissociated protein 1